MNEYDELTDLVTSPKKETPIWRVYGWPAAYVVACLLWCFAIPQLIQVVSFRWMETLVCVVIGSTLGMISFAACVAGLWRRTWLSAFFVGAGLCWLGVFFGHLGSLTDWSSASVVSFS